MNIDLARADLNDQIYTDVKLTIQDAEQTIIMHLHKIVLATNSLYFHKKFQVNQKTNSYCIKVDACQIVHRIILSLYGSEFNPSDTIDILYTIKWRYYLRLPNNLNLFHNLTISPNNFKLFLDVVQLFDLDYRLLQLIKTNLPPNYLLPAKLSVKILFDDYLIVRELNNQIVVDSLFIDHQLSTINDDAVLLAATTKLVASMALNKIKLWNYQNTLVSEINAENVLMMEFDFKSNLVAMCQNQIIIWSENGQPKHTHTLQLGLANFLKMKFDSTKKILFTSTSTNEIISWNTELGRSISSYCYFYSEIIDFAIAPNNALLASVTASNIKVFNYRTNHFVFEKDLIEDPKSVSFTSNSKILIVGYTNKIELWQLETKTLKQLIQIEYQIQNAWTLLNKFIVVECIDNENKKIIVLDQTTYETLSALTMKTTCYAIINK